MLGYQKVWLNNLLDLHNLIIYNIIYVSLKEDAGIYIQIWLDNKFILISY